MASFGRGLLVLWLSCSSFVSGMRVPLRDSRTAQSAKTTPEPGDVIRMPRLAVARADGTEHWMVTLDEDGVVGSDREVVRTSQMKVMFDPSSRFTRVPNDVADAIYARVPGANYASVASMGRLWVLPCDYELNVTFTFAGIPYPFHPLDAVMDAVPVSANASNEPRCTGAFQPMEETGLPYDIALGTSFLRNVHVSKNAVNDVDDPYVQLLSTFDPAEAHREFVQQRVGGPSMADVHSSPTPAGQTVLLTKRASSNRGSSLPWIIVGGVVGALVLAFAIAAAGIYVYGKRYRHLHSPPPSPPIISSSVLEIEIGSANSKVDLATTPPTPPSARSLSFWRDPMERTRYRQAQDGLAASVAPRKKLSIFRKKSMSAKSTTAKSMKRKTRGFPAALAFALNLDKPLPDPHANGDVVSEDGAGRTPPRSPGKLPSRPPAVASNPNPIPIAAPPKPSPLPIAAPSNPSPPPIADAVDSPTLGYQFDQPPPITSVLKESPVPRALPPPAATVVKGSSRPRPLPRPPAQPQSESGSGGRIPPIQPPAASDTRR